MMNIFNRSNSPKVAELRSFLQTCTVQELHSYYPRIVDNIFGLSGGDGWNLHMHTLYDNELTREMHSFLGAHGPLMEAICTRLMIDQGSYRYNFPIAWLSETTRQYLMEANINNFFLSKVVFNAGQLSANLSLNAFEYYFFYFFCYIVHPKWKERIDWKGSVNHLYGSLLEDYLKYFLFLDSRSSTLLGLPNSPKTSPINNKYSTYQNSTDRTSSRIINRLIPEETRKQRRNVMYDVGDFWHTDTFLQIALEMWLNQTDRKDSGSPGSHSPYQMCSQPSIDQVCMVRVLIKYLHHFVYLRQPSMDIKSAQHANILQKLHDYKRFVVLRLVSTRIYDFLTFCVHHWPYDITFRIVLETWLTAIQPWRYQDSPSAANISHKNLTRADLEEWMPWISEHYLLYASFLWSLLLRLQRVDLNVSRNAHMLFRLAKVISQPHFKTILMIVEDKRCGLISTDLYGTYSYNNPAIRTSGNRYSHGAGDMTINGGGTSHTRSPGYYGDPLVSQSGSLTTGAVSSSTDQVRPIWSEESKEEARKLIIYAQTLLDRIRRSRLTNNPERGGDNGADGGWFSNWYSGNPDSLETLAHSTSMSSLNDYQQNDNFKQSDASNIEDLLSHAISNLKIFFDLHDQIGHQVGFDSDHQMGPNYPAASNFDANTSDQDHNIGIPDCIETDAGTVLTPLGRYQIANNLRRFNVVYNGDPDKQPIRSFENRLLVQMTSDLANYLNTKFDARMVAWCCRSDIGGRIARHFFLNPTARQLHRNHQSTYPTTSSPLETASPATSKFSPINAQQRALLSSPRISLRPFASYRVQLAILGIYLACYLVLGVTSPVAVAFLILLFVFVHGFLTVLISSDTPSIPIGRVSNSTDQSNSRSAPIGQLESRLAPPVSQAVQSPSWETTHQRRRL